MELTQSLLLGLQTAVTLPHLALCFAGAVIGTLIGVLPRIGTLGAMALLLPVVPAIDAASALIMLAAIVYGAQYGASTAAILVQGAEEGATDDGYQMARQGRGGAALSIAALGSFFAGCAVTLLLALLAPPLLTGLAFHFGAAEYFSLMLLGLIGATVFASGSVLKSACMAVLGLLLAQVGLDPVVHLPRFGFGLAELARPQGIGVVVIAIGLFGIGEVVAYAGRRRERSEVAIPRRGELQLTAADVKEAWPSVLRGTTLGAVLGMLPGSGARLASLVSYAVERRVTARPRVPFGRGAIQGVAGPESANNAGAQASFVPMWTLGIPPNATMALLAAAIMLKGLLPGPHLMSTQPQLFWGVIASMWVGNGLLLALNLPLIAVWARLLVVPYRWLYPALLMIGCLGAYSLRGNPFDVEMAALFAFAGFVFHKLDCAPAPLLLAYVLAPLMEDNLRQALKLSGGDWGIFITRPWSAGLLGIAALMILLVMLPSIRHRREEAFHED